MMPDIGAHLRQLADVGTLTTQPPVPGLQRARAIQTQLPDLVPGQRFAASLQRTQADGTFQALVAGRVMTLALTGAAKAGDTLELVVVARRPGLIVARPLGEPPLPAPSLAAAAGVHAGLSPAARLISYVLGRFPTAGPTVLADGQPLLARDAVSAARLAPALRQAWQTSGLFYEAHLLRWLAGRLTTATLAQEPQARRVTPCRRAPRPRRGMRGRRRGKRRPVRPRVPRPPPRACRSRCSPWSRNRSRP